MRGGGWRMVGGDEEPGRDREKEKRDRQTERRLISWPADNSSFSEPEPCAQGRGEVCSSEPEGQQFIL